MSLDLPANPDKVELVLKAFAENKVTSFADLGACWGVNAAYTIAALLCNQISRAYVVDTHPTPLAMKRLEAFGEKVKFVKGEFGFPETYKQVEKLDAVILFDVLLHQANPHWDEILAMYAEKARVIVIYNQNFVGPKTLRLTDLDAARYASIVPKRQSERDQQIPATVKHLFDNLDQQFPGSAKTYRDAHHHGQWAITDPDLVSVMHKLNFRKTFFKDYGPFHRSKFFRNMGYVFVKNVDELPFAV